MWLLVVTINFLRQLGFKMLLSNLHNESKVLEVRYYQIKSFSEIKGT